MGNGLLPEEHARVVPIPLLCQQRPERPEELYIQVCIYSTKMVHVDIPGHVSLLHARKPHVNRQQPAVVRTNQLGIVCIRME